MKLQIEKQVYGGAGLAHEHVGDDAGNAVFVPFTLNGEMVEAELTGEKSDYAEAALVEVIAASTERVAPGCAHFGTCGGCHYQHATYAAQVEIKTQVLRETLERAGLVDLPAIEAHTSEAWGYRNRIRLRIAEVDGELRMGYSRPQSAEFLPVRECPIATPVLWRAAEALLAIAAKNTTALAWLRTAVEVEFFAAADESCLMMTLFVRKERAAGFKELCEALHTELPELVGAGVAILTEHGGQRSRRNERPKAGAAWGAAGLSYEAAGRRYWVSRGGFFQVNRTLVEELVRIVTTGRSGSLAWDLYAGVGLFSRALAESFARVIAVEGGETAARDLAAGLKGQRTVWASTVEFLRSAVIQRERPELVVMDPPRAGVGAEVVALLARVKTQEMVYVSCDPVTLSRDLRGMVDSGYRISEVHLVDLFPQTFHIETVVVLRR